MFKELSFHFPSEFSLLNTIKTKSYKHIRESFQEKFGDGQTLPNSTTKRIIEHSEVHFCLEDALCSGKPTVRTEEKREEVRQETVVTLCVLVCKLAQCIPTLSYMSVYPTLKDLHLCPYRVQTRQELKPTDPVK